MLLRVHCQELTTEAPSAAESWRPVAHLDQVVLVELGKGCLKIEILLGHLQRGLPLCIPATTAATAPVPTPAPTACREATGLSVVRRAHRQQTLP